MSEPVAWTTMPDADDWTFISGHEDPNGKLYGKWFPLYTADAIREAVLAEREAISKFCAYVYEKSASRDDGLDPFENGIKWTTEQISSWTEKRGAA